MKRLFICQFEDNDWIAAIVANSHKQAKKIFYKNYRGTTGDEYTEWIDIRIRLSKSKLDVSNMDIGEIGTDLGYKHKIYSDLY